MRGWLPPPTGGGDGHAGRQPDPFSRRRCLLARAHARTARRLFFLSFSAGKQMQAVSVASESDAERACDSSSASIRTQSHRLLPTHVGSSVQAIPWYTANNHRDIFFKTCLHVSIILLKHKLKCHATSSRSFLRVEILTLIKKIKEKIKKSRCFILHKVF
jgi:hypothetical protein